MIMNKNSSGHTQAFKLFNKAIKHEIKSRKDIITNIRKNFKAEFVQVSTNKDDHVNAGFKFIKSA